MMCGGNGREKIGSWLFFRKERGFVCYLALDKVSYPRFRHDGDCDGLHNVFDH